MDLKKSDDKKHRKNERKKSLEKKIEESCVFCWMTFCQALDLGKTTKKLKFRFSL
jgi:hypothetical protein